MTSQASIAVLSLAALAVAGVGLASALAPHASDEARELTRDAGMPMIPLNHVLSTGQSLSTGFVGHPPLSRAQPHGHLMFSRGVMPGGPGSTPSRPSSRDPTSRRWFYFPEQRPDEVPLLKIYDSKTDGTARLTAHSAFDDPSSPVDAPERRSIEVRTLGFWSA